MRARHASLLSIMMLGTVAFVLAAAVCTADIRPQDRNKGKIYGNALVAKIIAVDNSSDMMRQFEKRLEEENSGSSTVRDSLSSRSPSSRADVPT